MPPDNRNNVIPLLPNQLHEEIVLIKELHLKKITNDVADLKQDLSDHRIESNFKIDKLDNRMWGLVFLAVTTLISVVGGAFAIIISGGAG